MGSYMLWIYREDMSRAFPIYLLENFNYYETQII
jgi:hypothetical protein